ncbi:MAG: SGNH/GDSL hydrolase family protein [Atopobiaceae bacterium]|nr:SGNH/GDSL hydrolase family protein [Atopobiaceae bacterium]
MALSTTSRAADLLHGCVGCAPESEGWVRPVRFTTAQLRALGSVRAWHPGLYKRMAACTAGVCLEFETDASHVSVEVAPGAVPRGTVSTLRDVERHSGSAPDPGVVSVEIDDLPPVAVRPDDRHLVEIDLSEPGADPADPVALPGMGRRRRVRVWLPCLTTCAVRDVFFDGGHLGPIAERRTLLVLGDSIAQGFVADQPAATWPALLARRAGLDLVNQGVGGQVFQPGSLWGMEELDPAAIVVELGENYRYEPCAASAIGRDVRAYLSEVASAWPETPTWVLGVPPHTEDVYPTHPRSCFAEVDDIISDAAGRHPSMTLVDASTLLDGDRLGELLADGSDHPGPRGQEMIAGRLYAVMGLVGEKDVEAQPEEREESGRSAERETPEEPEAPKTTGEPAAPAEPETEERAPTAAPRPAAPKSRPKKSERKKHPSSKGRRSRRSRR